MVKKRASQSLINIDETLKKDFTSIFVSDNDNFDTMFLQNSKKDMINYVPYCDDETNIYHKAKRKQFIDKMNKWLNEPVMYESSFEKNECVSYDEMQEDINASIKKKDSIKNIMNQVVNIIEDSGFTLHDMNQFKEDLTYFFYRASD